MNGGGDGGQGASGLPGGGGGGGASDVRLTDAVSTRILVAGGGGGAGSGPGGAGGGAAGVEGGGPLSGAGATEADGGSGGLSERVFTQHSLPPRVADDTPPPGCGGIGWSTPFIPRGGTAGRGQGAADSGAGGGGGGWYGGGSGGGVQAQTATCEGFEATTGLPGGGGGGGSGYADPAWCTDVHSAAGAQRGDGVVIITPL